ncbi:hypothetical protein LTS18_008336 [Coniosporium uncinatum]|uniref:Uncharacterized protein n=1 Tax=Coniosporium uncinatum TaxID=93489 RepID=A0ACC3DN91_9PEZI|nr:hypothetical protein LTS18_008336 [Coniosporium uncinatum]
MWRILIASGILSLVIGTFNIAASYIFRDTSRGITARRVRSHGAVADQVLPTQQPPELRINTNPMSSNISQASFHINSPKKSTPKYEFKPFTQSPAKTFRAARDSLLPSYYSSPTHWRTGSNASPTKDKISPPYPISERSASVRKQMHGDVAEVRPMEISSPLNVNPQFAHLVKPDLAHHPSARKPDGFL